MTLSRRILSLTPVTALVLVLVVLVWVTTWATAASAQDAGVRVLWWNANPTYQNQQNHHRKAMADHLARAGEGGLVSATTVSSVRPGDLGRHLATAAYDVIVIDTTNQKSSFDAADLAALQRHYASGHQAIMLDGSLWIRSIDDNETTRFPGRNGATGDLTINQIMALADAGGGTLIGTDHDAFQVGANAALSALLPGARFKGRTVPSKDGDFVGRTLLAHLVPVRPGDILEHWQTVPSQGEVPVGSFTDFLGQPVTLHTLVETADQPGGGVKRPYVSASFDPGAERTAIGSTEAMAKEPVRDNMPTRKGPPS